MTTMDAVRLSNAVQSLIDARLDTIDRMLLGASRGRIAWRSSARSRARSTNC